MLKILHIAAMNFAGVPFSFYDMHNKCGDYSHLVTLHKNPHAFPEDICLEFPLPNFSVVKKWRKYKAGNPLTGNTLKAHYFQPRNILEKIYFDINDITRKPAVERIIRTAHLNEFDIVHYDSGMDFYRNSAQARKWKKEGKKIVCCYYGSDLRIRGLIREMEAISDLNITSEFDHLALKKDLHYVFYPYDSSEVSHLSGKENEVLTIVHSPTNRIYKGTELILTVIERLKKKKKINFLLLENMPRDEVLQIKKSSHIAIDQVGGVMGGTGYGKAGIETIAMGIPTITNMTEDYRKWLPENPFIVANDADSLYKCLIQLIESPQLRYETGEKGKQWLSKYHGYKSVNQRLLELYKQNKII